MAWLNTAPDVSDKAREKGIKADARRVGFERKHGVPLDMPECAALHIVAYLFDIGPTLGEAPVTHGEIRAWMDNSGIELSTWEAAMLRHLSLEYMHERQVATKPGALPPWRDAPYVTVDPAEQAKRLQRHIEGLAK